VPSPAPALPQPASSLRAIDLPSHSSRPKRRTNLQVGVVAFLVGAAFMLGRLTAPTPTVTSDPMAGEVPMAAKAASLEATVKAIPKPHPAPMDTTAPMPTAAAVPSSVPNAPVEAVGMPPAPTTNAPSASRSALTHTSAPDVPQQTATPVRPAPPPRVERLEPTETTPPSSPAPVNPFVQAVQDDIKEDEAAARKKR
jgi:hypothetical protein